MGIIGLRFNGTHSSDLGVYWKSLNRELLPARRIRRYTIPGRDGYYDVEAGDFDNRIISGTILLLCDDISELREKARSAAQWLAGGGRLVFDDEPDKAYIAKVVDAVDLEQLLRSGRCNISFDCQPFALGKTVTLPIGSGVNLLAYAGTAPAPCLITLRNDTGYTINNVTITVTRKRG